MGDDLSAEQRAIVESVRRAFGQEEPSQIRGPVDWAVVLSRASRHGLAPLVYSGLPSHPPLAPSPVRSMLRATYLGAVLRTEVWVEPTLRRVLALLTGSGLEPIVLKGAALAYLAYPEPAHRTLSDIDVLLPREHLRRASEILVESGFRIADEHPDADHHLQPHYADEGGVAVELHDRLLPERHPFTIDLDLLRDRSEIRHIAGVEGRVLAPADALLHTCVHLAYAHRYRWFPFRTFTDILAISTCCNGGLNWDLFLETVRRSRTAGAVYWPLRFSRAWVGAPIPDAVLSCLAPPTVSRRLVGAVAEPRYILDNDVPLERGSGALYRMLLDFSLYDARSTGEQLALYLGSPRRVVRALTAYLGSPELLARILVGLCSLVARRPK